MSFATGKELDDTGLYYFGDRFYDPSLGRFTSPDQLAEGRPFDSAYVYVGNNPMNRVDPDGNWWFLVTGAVSAVVDYGAQVATNCYSNPDGDWSEVLWDDVSMTSVAVSFGTGMVGGGVSTLSKANKISKVTTAVANTTVTVSGSVANQALSGEGISVNKTVTDLLMGEATKMVAKPVKGVLGGLIENEVAEYTAQKMNSKLVSKTIGVLTADPGINDNKNEPIFPLVGGSNQGTSFGFLPAVQDNTYVAMPPQ
jgi:RHS repeat-associated protein